MATHKEKVHSVQGCSCNWVHWVHCEGMKHPARIAAEKAVTAAHAKINAAKTDAEAELAIAEFNAAVRASCEADKKYPTWHEIKRDRRRRYLDSIGLRD